MYHPYDLILLVRPGHENQQKTKQNQEQIKKPNLFLEEPCKNIPSGHKYNANQRPAGPVSQSLALFNHGKPEVNLRPKNTDPLSKGMHTMKAEIT